MSNELTKIWSSYLYCNEQYNSFISELVFKVPSAPLHTDGQAPGKVRDHSLQHVSIDLSGFPFNISLKFLDCLRICGIYSTLSEEVLDPGNGAPIQLLTCGLSPFPQSVLVSNAEPVLPCAGSHHLVGTIVCSLEVSLDSALARMYPVPAGSRLCQLFWSVQTHLQTTEVR